MAFYSYKSKVSLLEVLVTKKTSLIFFGFFALSVCILGDHLPC